MPEPYLLAIISALFASNIGLIVWTYNKLDSRVHELGKTCSGLVTDVAVIKAVAEDRTAIIALLKEHKL